MTEKDSHSREQSTYDVEAVQEKWLKIWDDLDPYRAKDDDSAERRYLLDL